MGPASDNAGYGVAQPGEHVAGEQLQWVRRRITPVMRGIDFSLGAAVVGFNGSGVG